MDSRWKFRLAVSLLLTGPALDLAAQTPVVSSADLAIRLAGMTAVTGYERAMVDTLLSLLPGSERDRAGNAVLVFGGGAPRRLAACPLDETGFAVGRVRPDGWLTLHRSPARLRVPGPLFDQQLEGQRVTVFGRRGPVPGVVAVRSVHLTRGRASVPGEPFSADDAFVDLGAATDGEVAALGVGLLSPVALAKRPHGYGADKLAAPMAGRRAACAALLAAARRAVAEQGTVPLRGTTVVAFVVEQQLSARGLLTLATNRGPFEETWVADDSAGAGKLADADLPPGPRAALGRLRSWAMPTGYPGTAVETVALGQVEQMSATIAAWLRGEAGQ
jgi:putative aminopeptidase FrvX